MITTLGKKMLLIGGVVASLMTGNLLAAEKPPVLPDALWLKADEGVTLRQSDKILLWANRVADNKPFHGIGDTASENCGKLVGDALNGKPVVSFNNTYMISDFSFAQWPAVTNIFGAGGTVFMVLKPEASVTTFSKRLLNTCGTGQAGWELIYNQASEKMEFIQWFGGAQCGDWQSDGVFKKGAYHLLTLAYDNRAIANDPSFYLNGRQVAISYDKNPESGVAAGEISGNMWMVTRAYARGPEDFSGNIAEIMIYRRILTDSERRGVEVYLADKYGLEVAR
ncbi:MAG: LamG-like jellyroll fold domain-containing protein [Victivallales bacterium]